MPAKVDYKGRKFGRLHVLEEAPKKGRRTCWKCLCTCGNICIIRTDELRSGDTESCGCFRKELSIQDITGRRFGFLTAIKICGKNKNCTTYAWECKCDCGTICVIDGHSLRTGHTKSCGCYKPDSVRFEEAKKKFYENIDKTETCWNWKGIFWQKYGIIFYKKYIAAHRFSYMIHTGNLEKGKCICHTCDNPKCVNPEHLYQGTSKDNFNDMYTRGRFKAHGKLIKPPQT